MHRAERRPEHATHDQLDDRVVRDERDALQVFRRSEVAYQLPRARLRVEHALAIHSATLMVE
jgi:hypothetical protein